MSESSESTSRQAVLAAAQRLVEAFGRHDTRAYFDAFAPEASFIFHSHNAALPTRAAYEALWSEWERDLGFRVLGCHSLEPAVQLQGTMAVFRHRVRTTVSTLEGEVSMDERETIVFQQGPDGRWLAVHEHLSPMPASKENTA